MYYNLSKFSVSVFIALHHLHHVTTDTLQYIRTIIIPNKRTLHNDKKEENVRSDQSSLGSRVDHCHV